MRAAAEALAWTVLLLGCEADGSAPGGPRATGVGTGGTAGAGARAGAGAGGSAGVRDAGPTEQARDAGQLDAGDMTAPMLSMAADDASPIDAGGMHDASPGTPTIVAVGYAGLRVTSFDLGRSWQHKRTLSNVAADDPDNLRGVTHGAGVFVAVGHKIFTSPDGETWDPRTHPANQWLGDVKYGNGRFVATGGYGYSAWSLDGIRWQQGGAIKTEASRSLAFGDGMFVTQTDAGNWYRSSDGASWTLLSGGHAGKVAFCAGEFRDADDCDLEPFHGAYVRAGGWNSGVIAWSDDASSWHDVQVGYVGGVNAFSFGDTP